jgi:hypothetical protein
LIGIDREIGVVDLVGGTAASIADRYLAVSCLLIACRKHGPRRLEGGAARTAGAGWRLTEGIGNRCTVCRSIALYAATYGIADRSAGIVAGEAKGLRRIGRNASRTDVRSAIKGVGGDIGIVDCVGHHVAHAIALGASAVAGRLRPDERSRRRIGGAAGRCNAGRNFASWRSAAIPRDIAIDAITSGVANATTVFIAATSQRAIRIGGNAVGANVIRTVCAVVRKVRVIRLTGYTAVTITNGRLTVKVRLPAALRSDGRTKRLEVETASSGDTGRRLTIVVRATLRGHRAAAAHASAVAAQPNAAQLASGAIGVGCDASGAHVFGAFVVVEREVQIVVDDLFGTGSVANHRLAIKVGLRSRGDGGAVCDRREPADSVRAGRYFAIACRLGTFGGFGATTARAAHTAATQAAHTAATQAAHTAATQAAHTAATQAAHTAAAHAAISTGTTKSARATVPSVSTTTTKQILVG